MSHTVPTEKPQPWLGAEGCRGPGSVGDSRYLVSGGAQVANPGRGMRTQIGR